MYILYIQPLSADSKALYSKSAADYLAKPYGERDAGLDLYAAEDTKIDEGTSMAGMGLKAALYDTARGIFRAYWMLPRSSISKTSLRLANSVGLIDAGYRGEIKAALYTVRVGFGTTLERNTRIVQLASPDLLPFDDIKVVDEIPGGATLRGEGGFGSTGVGAARTDADVAAAAALVMMAGDAAPTTPAAPTAVYGLPVRGRLGHADE